MPSRRSLRYLQAAQDDLVSILDWIALDSPSRAAAFVQTVDKRIGRLEAHPEMGRVPRNDKLKKLGYRVLMLGNFLVFYLVRGSMIEIHRVIHGSKNLEDIL
ncbi:MAG TPA: type II toxin-antitoxin system RelE/ParE family toxin [bacterium]|nr:type II toxin-antitoxin system RelE/ParE family toxin [bacterium]